MLIKQLLRLGSPVDDKTYLMPPKKKMEVAGANDDQPAAVAVHQLEDIVAIILSWLRVNEIMSKRRVCKKWKEAARKTIVPLSEFRVDDVKKFNAMRVMTEAMPNLQQLEIGRLRFSHKYSDGEDPNGERVARFSHYTAHDIEIISNFSKLRVLEIAYNASLNGRYPVLFNSFPLLQKLSINYCNDLKWDLDMLAGFPMLKELTCGSNDGLTGNINSLRMLKDTLEKVQIFNCHHIEGNFMDLADFLHLRELNFGISTTVIGDIRDIGESDFSSLEKLFLPHGVYGGRGSEFQRISDGPELIRAIYRLKKQRPALFGIDKWYWILSRRSPDWYESLEDDEIFSYPPPFYIHFVKAGSRVGYRWTNCHDSEPCEVNWLDPEPDRESSDYGQYIEELEEIENEVRFYSGYHQPPTEEEYHRLREEA